MVTTLDKYLVHVYKARGAGGAHSKVPLYSVEVEAASPDEASSKVYNSLVRRPRQFRATETYAVWCDGAWQRLNEA